MGICLVVLTGPKVGTKFHIGEGFTIGRKNGDLVLDEDPKISGVHAKIMLDNKQQMVLVDQDSANGLILNGRKVRKISMMPGVVFRIGRTDIRVIKDDSALLPTYEARATAHVEDPREIKPENIAPKRPDTWQEKLTAYLDQQEPMVSSGDAAPVSAFSPALVLDFTEGLQADQKITLGYGPREAGFGHFDINLTDPQAPERAFELTPGPGSVQIKDLTDGRLLVNNKNIDIVYLEEGDVISVAQTKIKVRYL